MFFDFHLRIKNEVLRQLLQEAKFARNMFDRLANMCWESFCMHCVIDVIGSFEFGALGCGRISDLESSASLCLCSTKEVAPVSPYRSTISFQTIQRLTPFFLVESLDVTVR